jgi:hypothetical protein
MSKNKDIIRLGDKVKVIQPLLVERVGYDNNLEASIKYVEDNFYPQITKFVNSILNPDTDVLRLTNYHIVDRKVVRALAYGFVGKNIKSGSERKVFTKESPFLQNQVMYVVGIKYVHTGKYDPPYSTQDYYGEWDSYSGGLTDRKTHKLLSLDTEPYDQFWSRTEFPQGNWIEACNVEKVIIQDQSTLSGDSSVPQKITMIK